MKAYEHYQETEIEWIGEIPEHWGNKKLRYIGQFTSSGIDKKIKDNEPFVKIINFIDVFNNPKKILRSNKNYMQVTCSKNKRVEHQLQKGDLIFIPSSETIDEIGISALVDDRLENTAYSYHVLRFRFADNFDHYFKKYLCNNYNILNKFSSLAKGTTRRILKRIDFNDLRVMIPPLEEQTQIACYLDHKTSQIDKLIESNEKLITLLEEQRSAIINRAVTKGLDPDVKMKESGIDWASKVPEHWDTLRLKNVFEIVKRIVGEIGHDVLSITQKGIIIKDISSGAGQLSMDYSKYQLVGIGDFAMNHMDLLTGFVDISKFEGVVSPDYRVFKLKHENSIREYLIYILQLCYTQKIFYKYGKGVSMLGRWRLPAQNFKNFMIPVPPKTEQFEIAKYLNHKTSLIDKLIEEKRKTNEYLKEYRTALISKVVTGRIDVRDEVIPQSSN